MGSVIDITRMPEGLTHLERDAWIVLASDGIYPEENEYRFMKKRRFRFDFAWPSRMVALEIEGGTWSRGKSRHISPRGFENDCEKYSLAAVHCWRVIRVTSKQINEAKMLEWVRAALLIHPAGG